MDKIILTEKLAEAIEILNRAALGDYGSIKESGYAIDVLIQLRQAGMFH